MASNLKYSLGFGWGSVFLFLLTALIPFFTTGWLRVLAAIPALAILLYIASQWHKWNKRGWRQVHFRAMLTYASIAGEETARAEREGRPFSKVDACRALALAMTGPGREANVDAMIDALTQERGGYYARLTTTFGAKVFPDLDATTLAKMADDMRKVDFGPELVIANIIENTFGGEEAARYVRALIKRQAH